MTRTRPPSGVVLLLLLACCRREPAPAPSFEGLPFRYYLVGSGGAGELKPGFGVAITEERRQGGGRVARSRRGRSIPLGRLLAISPAPALGVRIPDGRLAFGWVIDPQAAVFARPDDRDPPVALRRLFDRVELAAGAPPGWRRTRQGYIRSTALRVPSLAARPPGLATGERFVDIDTATQTLTVYEGETPVFATLVSTGNAAAGRRYATPSGLHRIIYKMPSATMDDPADPVAPYSFEEVPWVQYFHEGIALHGAYWHRRFGHPISHGCVNLAPADARTLFGLTRAGSPSVPGTAVRVR